MKKRLLNKSIIIVALLVVFLLFGWRIYQENVPQGMKNRIKRWKDEQETIILCDQNGKNVTEQFFSDNEWNYKLKNYRSIYNYISEDMGTLSVDYGD